MVNVQRAAFVNLGGLISKKLKYLLNEIWIYFILDLATYDLVKRFVMKKFNLKDDYKTHTLSRLYLVYFKW